MAKNQKAQKGGRDRKISLDFTRAELEQLDDLRGPLSRSDFLAAAMAWIEFSRLQSTAGRDFFMLVDRSGDGWFVERDGDKFCVVRNDIDDEKPRP